MNEAKKNDQIQTIYPQYFPAQYMEDEINLIDIWITLRQYKKPFFQTFLGLLITGLLIALFVFSEKYTLTSAIQIGSIERNGNLVQLESAESLKSKLSDVIVPRLTAAWLSENPHAKKFETSVTNPKGSDVVLIQNKVKISDVTAFQLFQTRLTEAVITDHKSKLSLFQEDLLAQLALEKAKLTRLQLPETLQSQLDKRRLALQAEQSKLKHLEDNYQLIQQGGEKWLYQSLTEEERRLLTLESGKPDEQLLSARYEQALLENRIQQDEYAEKIGSIQLELQDIERNHVDNISDQARVVDQVQNKIDSFNRTRQVSNPVVSVKPSGLTRNLLMALVFVFSLFAAFAVVLLCLFRDKVEQRLRDDR